MLDMVIRPPEFFAILVTLPLLGSCGERLASPSTASGAAGTPGMATGDTGGVESGRGGDTNGGTTGPADAGGESLAGNGGAAGAPGGMPSTGGVGAGGVAGSVGLGGAGGTPSGSGGAAGDMAGVSGTGDGGSSAGSAGTSGGSAGASGTGAVAPACPSEPFPAPAVLSTADVCEDFELRYTWNEGPTWVASEQAFFFTNFVVRSGSGGDIIKYTPGIGCETFMTDVGCNGLTASHDGGLLAACQQSRSVVRFDLVTRQVTTIVSDFMGEMLDTPNDLVLHSNGTLYFTNATFELDGRPAGVGPAAFRLDPGGELSMIAEGTCNGIALSPDETRLYVLQLGMWDVDAEGVPSNHQSLFTSGDGVAVDCAGNVYASGGIYSAAGERIGDWGDGTNLAFGGEDGMTVLVVGRGTPLRELRVSVPGPP
jgi:sugar lactone lactonase YvrE